MTVKRSWYPVVFFLSGLGLGALWSPLERPHTVDSRILSHVRAENEEFVAQMRETYGEEAAEFVRQFEDMTVRIKEYPIDAWASPEGRFLIRIAGTDETIASDLRYPDTAAIVKELVRHYSFSCGGKTYSCDFGRSTDNSKMTNVQFHFSDANGGGLTYVDSDADGHWDTLSDRTREAPMLYERDGLRWKQREKDSSEEPHAVP